jgi:ABC-type sugar transport system ATPase subunit
MMSDFLRIEGISKAYPGVQALDGVSFSVQAGHVHALVGENGAGKSTLIQILAGAERSDNGELILQGESYRPTDPRDALRAGISTIYQTFNLMPERSVMHNILLGKEPSRGFGVLDFAEMRRATHDILTTLSAEHINPEERVENLRVGEQQVVEIARALLNRSQLLIMDEPTAALNRAEVDALFANIATLKAQGVTIIYVSHRLEEIFQLADTVTVLRDGKHISTHPIGEVTADSLIKDMIGRELADIFPERLPTIGEPLLVVDGLGIPGLLEDISLTLHRGEVLAVTGLAGSGKTELGQALFGALPPESGAITLSGKPFKPAPWRAVRRKLIALPEDRKTEGILQELPVKRNISLTVLSRVSNTLGIIRSREERRVAMTQVENLAIKISSLDQIVKTLSGGNQQKVALAKWLAVEPDVFILMEPTQGIDVGVKFEVYQFIAERAKEGAGVLMISSEIPEILGLSHRILVMREGRIVANLDTPSTNAEEILRHALGQANREAMAS